MPGYRFYVSTLQIFQNIVGFQATQVASTHVLTNERPLLLYAVKRCFGATTWTRMEQARCSTKGSLRDSLSSGENTDFFELKRFIRTRF